MNPKGGEIKPPWDGRRGGGQGEGSIVFYKEQETSLKEYMKETLKQMQISKGGEPLPSSPSCSAQGQPADLLLLAEGAPAGERQGCWELLSPPGAGLREAPEEPEETGFTQRKQSPCSASPTGMQLTELGQRRASRPGRGQLGNTWALPQGCSPCSPSAWALTVLCSAHMPLRSSGDRAAQGEGTPTRCPQAACLVAESLELSGTQQGQRNGDTVGKGRLQRPKCTIFQCSSS